MVCRYNEIRGTGLFRGILNCLNRKKKLYVYFIPSNWSLLYSVCIQRLVHIIDCSGKTSISSNSASKINRIFLIFTARDGKLLLAKTCSKSTEKDGWLFPKFVAFYTTKKSPNIEWQNGLLFLPGFAARCRFFFLTSSITNKQRNWTGIFVVAFNLDQIITQSDKLQREFGGDILGLVHTNAFSKVCVFRCHRKHIDRFASNVLMRFRLSTLKRSKTIELHVVT